MSWLLVFNSHTMATPPSLTEPPLSLVIGEINSIPEAQIPLGKPLALRMLVFQTSCCVQWQMHPTIVVLVPANSSPQLPTKAHNFFLAVVGVRFLVCWEPDPWNGRTES